MNPITSPDSRSVIRKLNFPGAKARWIHSSVAEIESLVVLVLMMLGRLQREMAGGVVRPEGGFGMRADLVDGLCVRGEGGTEEEARGGECRVRGLGGGDIAGYKFPFESLKRSRMEARRPCLSGSS
jgi:hypothetical protein